MQDLARFACSNSVARWVAGRLLWHRDTQLPRMPALYWGIEKNNLAAVRKALDEYARLGARHLLDGTGVRWGKFMIIGPYELVGAVPGSPVMLAVRSGSLELLELVVGHEAARCNLDVRLCLGRGCPPTEESEVVGLFVDHAELFPERWWASQRLPVSREWGGKSVPIGKPGSLHWHGSGQNALGHDLFGCQTALHWAVWAARPDMLRYLLDKGARVGLEAGAQRIVTDPECMISLLHTVLASAERFKGFPSVPLGTAGFDILPAHMSMLEILLDHGANPNLIYEPGPRHSPTKQKYWMERGSVLAQLLRWGQDELAKMLVRRGAEWWWPSPEPTDDYRLGSARQRTVLRPYCALVERGRPADETIAMIDFLLAEGSWDGSSEPLTDALISCLVRFCSCYRDLDRRNTLARVALHLVSRGAVAATPKRLDWIARHFPKWAWDEMVSTSGIEIPTELADKRRQHESGSRARLLALKESEKPGTRR